MRTSRVQALVAGLLVTGAVAVIGSDTASAAVTLQVCPTGCAFSAVAPAVAAAAPGDTVEIAAGTYSTFGVVIDKPITVRGAGAGQTILDGGGGSIGSTPGVFRILPGSAAKGVGEITISDLTVTNPSKNTTATTYFGISIGIKQVTTGISSITLTRLDIKGTGTTAAKPSYGVYADGGYSVTAGDRTAPTLTISDSTIGSTYYNGVGIDAYRGDVTIERNGLTEGGAGISALVFLNEYTPNQIQNPVVVRDNTSTGRLVAVKNIDYNAALAAMGGFADVTISGNTITDVGAGDFGILVSTNSVDGAPATRIGSAVIAGNTITGTGAAASTGISIAGAVVSSRIADNVVTRTATGVSVVPVKSQYAGQVSVAGNELRSDGSGTVGIAVQGGAGALTAVGNDVVGWQTGVVVAPDAAAHPGAVDLHENRIFGNGAGLTNTSTSSVSAEDNWWGCQDGPTGTSSYCNEASGPFTAGHWIRVSVVATGKTLDAQGRVPVTTLESVPVVVSLVRTDGSGDDTVGPLPSVFDDFPVTYDAQLGVLAGPATLGNGQSAAATYVAPGAAGEDLTRTVVDRESLAPTVTGEPVPLVFVITAVTPPNPTSTPTPTADPTPTPSDVDDPSAAPPGTASPGADGSDPSGAGPDSVLPDTGTTFPLWVPFAGLGLMVCGVIVMRLGRSETAEERSGRHR